MDKINKYDELIESAKQKKIQIYFSEKSETFEKKIPNFMVNVEEVQISKKLKSKFKPNSKGLTSITFNSFGSNLITTGSDNFIKIRDTFKIVKVQYIQVSQGCYRSMFCSLIF